LQSDSIQLQTDLPLWLRPLRRGTAPLPKKGNKPCNYPVFVRGKRYPSVRKASEDLGLTWRRIYQLLKSGEAQRV
jgi:hypothetical protein